MQVSGYQLKKFLKHLDITQDEAARRLKVSRQTINTWCKLAILDDLTLQNVKTSFPEFENWEKDNGNLLENPLGEYKTVGVPYYEDLDVTASVITSFHDYKEEATFMINYKHFNDCDAYLPVVGDSMHPKYPAGEIVAVKQIRNLDTLLWGETYLVITNDNANNLRTIKDVHYCSDETKVILRAANPDFAGDTRINKEDILSMYIVKGRIRRNQL